MGFQLITATNTGRRRDAQSQLEGVEHERHQRVGCCVGPSPGTTASSDRTVHYTWSPNCRFLCHMTLEPSHRRGSAFCHKRQEQMLKKETPVDQVAYAQKYECISAARTAGTHTVVGDRTRRT